MDMVKRIQNFVKYWYLRFLMATELYIVEPREKAAVYVVISILFGLLWLFNQSIGLKLIPHARLRAQSWGLTSD